MMLRIFQDLQPNESRWRINGLPAIITVWSLEEWAKLKPKPKDVQVSGNVVVQLKME